MDGKHKLIRKFHVTSAEVHDSRVVEELLDDNNTNRELWADSAYRSKERVAWLREHGSSAAAAAQRDPPSSAFRLGAAGKPDEVPCSLTG
ncbi:MAG: transposase [Desulfobulbus sp.]|nr:transposase [Desulfobulbus sp.]